MINYITNPVIIFTVCILASMFLSRVIWRWRENRAHERISPDFKLLRGPGESLSRKIAAIDDKLFSALIAISLETLVFLGGFLVASLISDRAEYERYSAGFLHIVVPLLILLELYFGIRILRLLSTRRNLYLGYFGERVVSENIETHRAKGAAIFHDVPLEGRAGSLNIDHVIVCPAGIFAIETKTRRKGHVREDRIDGKIIYDGAQLTYPWGADTHGLSQAMTNALWLEKSLDKSGLPAIHIQPILTFPGWRIEQTEAATDSTVRVLTPAQIPHYLDALPPVLNANQVKHIAQQLETLCRDVEF